MALNYSLLDFVWIDPGETAEDAMAGVVPMAQAAERSGYQRIWYAEQHNIWPIAATAPTILTAHAAANTKTIRVGPGGVLLPNYAPLIVAEQFGTLAALHPGRIDLGVGRSAGAGDPNTPRALRVTAERASGFADDVLELQAYLAGRSVVPGVKAIPHAASDVPIYILGSSLYGAELAARLGLPYGFASHFSPAALEEALYTYRTRYRPSPAHPEPYALITVNLIAAATEEEAQAQYHRSIRERLSMMLPPGTVLSEEERDRLVDAAPGHQVRATMTHLAIGTPETVKEYLSAISDRVKADEVMLVPAATRRHERLKAVELVRAPSAS